MEERRRPAYVECRNSAGRVVYAASTYDPVATARNAPASRVPEADVVVWTDTIEEARHLVATATAGYGLTTTYRNGGPVLPAPLQINQFRAATRPRQVVKVRTTTVVGGPLVMAGVGAGRLLSFFFVLLWPVLIIVIGFAYFMTHPIAFGFFMLWVTLFVIYAVWKTNRQRVGR